MAPFYGWGSTASRLEPLRGGSLLFTTTYIFHKLKSILLVSAQLSGNCPLIIEPSEDSEKNFKYLIFINLFKINFE